MPPGDKEFGFNVHVLCGSASIWKKVPVSTPNTRTILMQMHWDTRALGISKLPKGQYGNKVWVTLEQHLLPLSWWSNLMILPQRFQNEMSHKTYHYGFLLSHSSAFLKAFLSSQLLKCNSNRPWFFLLRPACMQPSIASTFHPTTKRSSQYSTWQVTSSMGVVCSLVNVLTFWSSRLNSSPVASYQGPYTPQLPSLKPVK